jgi:DNA repair exonuclease SbcCD ATPase subunit
LKLKFRNFLSFGNLWTEIDFTDTFSTFIQGENLDTGSANGAGKTSIFQALIYALYNKSISGISLPRLVNSTNAGKNSTQMDVVLEFSKAGNIYRIHRRRGIETTIIFEENDLDITPDSVSETDSLIEDIIGISYELFSKIIVFAGSDVPFLDLPISHQRQHIEELFNITILTEKANKLKKVIQSTETDIKVEGAIIREKQNNIDSYKKRLNFAEQKVINWEDDRDKTKARLEKQIESVRDIDFEKEKKLFDERKQLKDALSNVDRDLTPLYKFKKDAEKKQKENIHELEHLEGGNCPYCHQKLGGKDERIEELKQEIKLIELEIEDFNSEIKELETQLSELKSSVNEKEKEITYEDLPSLLKIKNDVEHMLEKIKDLAHAENPHFEAFEQVEQEEVADIDYQKIDELKSLKEHQSFLLKLLIDKNSFIRRKIINKTIPFLNSRLNYYSIELGLPHTVKFDDNISCSVSEYGRELDFGNLSGGEKKRVNLAMSLAFRDVLFHLHAKVNILLVDEIDASLCNTGVENVIQLIKKKTIEDNLSTWVIMHRAEVEGRFDRCLVVQKKGGFSSIEFKEVD